MGFPCGSEGKESAYHSGFDPRVRSPIPWVRFPGQEDPLEKEMATHSSLLAWRISGTEEPGGLHTVHRVTKSWT